MINLMLNDALSIFTHENNGTVDLASGDMNNLNTQYTQINQSDFNKWNHVSGSAQDSSIYQIHETSSMSDEFMQLNSSSSFGSGGSINFTDDTLDTNNTILNYAENIGDILVFYYTPVIVFVGIIGNILSVLVFFRTKLRKLSSSYYLAALGMSDSCFLVLAFISWLNFAEIHIIHHNVTCQLFFYLQGVCSFLSVWYVVAFTVERFIAVLYPLKRQSMCTVRRAVIVLCGLTVLALFFCAPLLFFVHPVYHAESNMTVCDIGEDYRHPMKVFNYIDTVLVFVIPFTGIVVLNSITGYTVWKVAGVRRSMTLHRNRKSNLKDSSGGAAKTTVIQQRCMHPNGQNSIRMTTKRKNVTTTTSTAAKNGRSHRSNSATSSQMKVTKMLLLVSSVFVLLNLPSYLVRVMAYIETEPSETQSASKITIILQYYCWLFFITNFGINFVLYCMSGQNFRKAVISMFSKRIQNRQQQADCDRTQVTVVTEYVRASRTFSTYRNNNRTASVRNASMTTTAATVNASDGISINRHLNVLTNNNFTEFNSLACNSDENVLCSPWIEMSEVP